MAISRRLFVLASTALVASTGTSVALAAPGEAPSRIPVSPSDSEDDLVRKASQVRPTARQITWQNLGRTAFLHFGVNTFTGLEWGTGDEDPDVFQPVGLDTDQWARALRDGGFELAILTVKHHDGFVLYPSRYTDHSVASSSWRGGRGDVLRSFADSMRRHGIKVGVYVSPADENQYLHGVYANGSARTERTVPTPVDGDDRTNPRTFTLDATDYGAHMLNQLYEVLTEYGPVDEVWFDGAQGRIPPDKVEKYDWDSWYALVRALAPDASIAVSGPDVRWVGNEGGLAREDEWSVVPVTEKDNGRTDYALAYDAPDEGSRAALVAARPVADYLQWWPAECDVSIRDGWFYHPDQQPKSVDELTDIYFRSVGRNSVLLLNIPPDTQGLLPAADVVRLREFRERVDRELPEDLGRGAVVRSSPGVFTVDLRTEHEVDRIRLAEDIRHGQQVESFVVEAYGAGAWSRVAGAGTIGASRILLLPVPVRARHWRLRVTGSRQTARIAEFALHRSRT
ncbi:alpha-L-fucosidase [Streptomyces olivochromogenes]|uniref:alpha-L-fucosidase n=1 Tax=Streptomyces olivochromogenes TaxID=1963 RepID=A0A250V4U8_STROL|nr:alpha-L-fucosidase [Streptomyces olivochromogenes]KUN49409.1 alpha-1,3/4-fucosidase [Streptomyces olivochromogenes]GAX49208.1 alpha-1,3/4-fucosidase [Streptomyces olivochromogenes]